MQTYLFVGWCEKTKQFVFRKTKNQRVLEMLDDGKFDQAVSFYMNNDYQNSRRYQENRNSYARSLKKHGKNWSGSFQKYPDQIALVAAMDAQRKAAFQDGWKEV